MLVTPYYYVEVLFLLIFWSCQPKVKLENLFIVVDAYGNGRKPCIQAPDASLYAVLVYNSNYLTLQNIEVVNTGQERMLNRTGVKILCEDYGISHNVAYLSSSLVFYFRVE